MGDLTGRMLAQISIKRGKKIKKVDGKIKKMGKR